MRPRIYVCGILMFTARCFVNGGNTSNEYDFIKEKRELPKNCGRTRLEEEIPRVINGKVAKLGQVPWIVRLGRYESPEELWFYCGGALINRYFVVSAAHCEEYTDIIRVGENYADYDIDCDEYTCAPPHQDLRIKRHKITDYCRVTHKNDVLMIELLDPAKFNDFVQPICFPPWHWSMNDYVGQDFTLAGWGMTNGLDPHSIPIKLMYITVMINSPKKCKQTFLNFMEKGQFCMEYPKGGQNGCHGDSGGPAYTTVEVNGVERVYLFGVTSYGGYKCVRGTVYSSILYYRKHILKFMRQS